MALSKTKRNRMYKLAKQAKRDRLKDSTPRKVKRLHLEIAKLTVTKIELNRICIQPRGNEAIPAMRDYGVVLALKAEDFNRGKARY